MPKLRLVKVVPAETTLFHLLPQRVPAEPLPIPTWEEWANMIFYGDRFRLRLNVPASPKKTVVLATGLTRAEVRRLIAVVRPLLTAPLEAHIELLRP